MEAVRRKKKMETTDSHTYDDTFNRKVHFWGKTLHRHRLFHEFFHSVSKGMII